MRKATVQNDIAIVLTENSDNRKTGDMIQTWIIRSDISPIDACKTGKDSAICGNCPLKGKSCYVNVGQAPTSVYHALKRGSYNNKTIDTAGKLVRCGAYGDPAVIDMSTWNEILHNAKGNTGYTHQWRTCSNEYATFLMASCETKEDREEAKKLGYRTFRVRRQGEPLLPGEINCPADHPTNPIQCEKCLKCNGNKSNGKDISIVVHGSRKNNF